MSESIPDTGVQCSECLAIALEEGKPVYIQASCANCTGKAGGKASNGIAYLTDTCEISTQPSPDNSILETIEEGDEINTSLEDLHTYRTVLTNYESELLKQEKEFTCQIHKLEESIEYLDVEEKKQIEALNVAHNVRIKQLEHHYDELKVKVETSFRLREKQLKRITGEIKGFLLEIQDKINELKKTAEEFSDCNTRYITDRKLEIYKRKQDECESQTIEVIIPDFHTTIRQSKHLTLDDSVAIAAPAPTLVTRKPDVIATCQTQPPEVQGNKIYQNSGDSLDAVSGKLWTRKKATSVSGWPYCLRLIHGQLWQCHRGGITIYDDDLVEQRAISSRDIGEVYDATALSNGEIVVATDTGLYHITINGKQLYEITKGAFTGVVEDKNYVYAVNRHSGTVQVYQPTKSWVLCHSFKLQCKTGYFITMSIHNDLLYAALSEDSKIVVYSLTGELHSTYGSAGVVDIGQLDWPYLCYTDTEGAALIADYYNERLQVLTVGRQWSVVDLQPEVLTPRSALLFNDKLFIASWDDKTLSLYESL